jgi:hypothetical protein
VVIYTSREVADPHAEATARVRALGWQDFESALAAHAAQWTAIWERADVRIAGSPATEQALRFNAYNLASAADRDPQVSVGARALTGRAYEGHIFWDVELFKLPFYLHTCPDVARCLLLYRHRTLDGARRRARELGYRGACYAWESTVTGDDVTPTTIRLRTTGKEIPIFTGTQQVHVTAGVTHAVWRYWEATRDSRFPARRGPRDPRGDGPLLGEPLHTRPAALAHPRPAEAILAAVVMAVIDGVQQVAEHGPRDMPVWGIVFDEELRDQPHTGYTLLLRVRVLSDYLSSIQEP